MSSVGKMQNRRLYNIHVYIPTSIKNNCLMKSEVGMAVLKSKQTRVVGVISIYV